MTRHPEGSTRRSRRLSAALALAVGWVLLISPAGASLLPPLPVLHLLPNLIPVPTVAPTPPASATGVNAAQASNSTSVIVSWFPPAGATSEKVGAYSMTTYSYVTGASCSGTCSTVVFPGFAPGPYVFVVWSGNAAGQSAGVASPVITVAAQSSAAPTPVVIDDVHAGPPVNRALFGTNYAIWEKSKVANDATRQPWPSVVAATSAMGLRFMRMDPAVNLQACGNTDCTYHWMMATPGAPGYSSWIGQFALSPDEWMQHIASLAGPAVTPMIQVNLEAGTVSEAEDWVAYMNGSVSSLQPLSDATTVGHWAQLRAANGHAAPYGAHFWELGNEEFSIHPCSGGALNGAGCVNHPPPACTTLTDKALYGCLVTSYATAMKAVDSSLAIVASDFDGSDLSQVHTTAGALIDAIDVHQYTDAPVDPYGTTFVTDGQLANYPVTYTTTTANQPVTIAAWTSAGGPAHIDVYVDSLSPPAGSFSVTSASALPYPITLSEPTVGNHSHTITVVACTATSLDPTLHVCAQNGGHTVVDLRRLTVTVGGATVSQLVSSLQCFSSVHGPAGTTTTLVDTRVATTSGGPGTGNSPGTPWRLGSSTDFPIAFTAGSAAVFGPGAPNQSGKLQYWRDQLTSSGFGSTPLVLGEYAGWGGCDQQPPDLSMSQASAIWSALITQTAYADQSVGQPILGAAEYTFSGGTDPICASWALMATKLTASIPCQGSDTAYATPTGLAMAQFGALGGASAPVAVQGGPAVVSWPAGTQPGVYAPGVTAVASKNGSVVTVVLVNACPPGPTQCGPGTVPVQLSLASGTHPTTASATTVSQSPFAINTDGSPANVSRTAVTASISGTAVAVNVPAFSITTVTINLA